MGCFRRQLSFTLLLLLLLQTSPWGFAYSVLTHQQIIDLSWRESIRPVLLSRYPNATPEELRRAQAFAYGGCAIQDAGYYPFGHVFMSDLTHYVRSGDFVAALIRDARNVDELAFALGALSHYVGDSYGHQDAVNPSTAIEFPNLAAKYGPVVTYDESPHGHVRTEFAFDINQLSKRRFAPSAYLQHIGLKVSARLLEQAFHETYGLNLRSMMVDRKAAIGSYRRSVRTFLPDIAYAEVLLHKKNFPDDLPSEDFDKFQKRLADADFNNGWDKYRKKAGVRTHLLAFVIVIVPKIGPMSYLAIRGPNPQTEEKYVTSVNRTLDRYAELLGDLARQPLADPRTTMNLENRDLDTGYRVKPGSYALTDETYAKLLDKLTKLGEPLPDRLKQDIEDYYADPAAPIVTKKNKKAWQRVQAELAQLRTMLVVPVHQAE
jgi:Zinc dependent phospholipase C